jgi:ubiquinone/menaquinone biosynthesis C-methylase UbiE
MISECLAKVPSAKGVAHDVRHQLPFTDQSFDVVIASLSLHYFSRRKTREIISEIHRCLSSGGYLLCRLNSTNDKNYGARATSEKGTDPSSEHYHLIGGTWKRFFDKVEMSSLFGRRWHRLSLEEQTIKRYELPKVVWEVIVMKRGP